MSKTTGSHKHFHHPVKPGTVTVAGQANHDVPKGTLNAETSGVEAEMKCLVIYEKSTTGYGAYMPDLPGLGVVGKTLEETKHLIREGIEAHIQVMREHGEIVPALSSVAEEVDIPLSA